MLGRALDRLHPHTGEWMPNLPSFGGTYHSGGKAYFTQPIEADAETFGWRVIDLLPARWPKSAAQQAGNAGGATKATVREPRRCHRHP
ncbi:MAG TPA: hypothetical protein VFS21_34400 [Roseiflexaceae bacterium]|nr:hypothetical protein [Roseiflexaceae bacterium]